MEPGTLTKVLNDFLTTEEGELSLTKGEYFLVYKVVDRHWYYGQSNNRFGKFPANRLHKVDEIPEVNDNEKLYISIAPFRGEQPGDLSFCTGELIVGSAEASSGWLTGYIDSRQGIFPASYVWHLDSNVVKDVGKKKVKRKATVKAKLQAQLSEELDLDEGETVTVTEIIGDGWCRGYKENGKEGIFPEGFITYQDNTSSHEIEATYTNNVSRTNNANATIATASAVDNSFPASALSGKIYKDFGEYSTNKNEPFMDDPAPSYDDLFPEATLPKIQVSTEYHPLGLKPYAITLYPFNSQFPNELSFEAGEVVELIRHIDNEWAEGMIDKVKGIFPVSYVNIIVDCVESQNDNHEAAPKVQDDLKIDDQVKVLYKFDAQMDGDLNVLEGEIVTVVEITDDNWVKVKNSIGETGLSPRSYLTKEFEQNNEEFHDALDDIAILRPPKEEPVDREIQQNKRLSEPHRPAPPAPTPGRVPLQKQNNQETPMKEVLDPSSTNKQKKADQRQNVITELYLTEKDYIRDLKMTYETFNLHNPSFLESKGIDVNTLFGNIFEITEIAEELLELIQRAMKGCDEDYQTIGPCFLKMEDKMRIAYEKYCNNHELSLALLQKYEDNKEIMKIFEKGVETLRIQVACFDMNSVLIKPVQRILKYPLILNELLKSTEDDHPDKPKIDEAAKAMAGVASYINEHKRKKELASKYLSSNTTLIGKMANLSMHSVAKKSSRLSAKLSATLGLTNLRADPKFDELVKDFISLERSTKQFLKDVEQCIECLDHETLCGEILTEQLHQYYLGVRSDEIGRLREIRNTIRSQFLVEFKTCIEKRVIDPLKNLIGLLAGPELLINKRHDKMLDYDNAISKNEKYKIPEDLHNAKSVFEALNQQLLEELPVFIEAAASILYNCIGAFTNARKLYNGKIMKKYLIISETGNPLEDILESFTVQNNLLYNQITRLSYGGTNTRIEDASGDYCLQSEAHRKAIKTKYPSNKLYIVTQSVSGTATHDLSVTKGTLVGVIKTQDPMGDTSKWFVDNGAMQGFLESQFLQVNDETRSMEDSASSTTTNSSVDLMSLDSPVKNSKRYSDDLQNIYANVHDELDSPPKYESIVSTESEPRSLYENTRDEFVYALYDFNVPDLEGTLAIKEGQALKVLAKHDQKNNTDWWYVQDRTGGKGYVPHNYVRSST